MQDYSRPSGSDLVSSFWPYTMAGGATAASMEPRKVRSTSREAFAAGAPMELRLAAPQQTGNLKF
ncbi:hypothetical protein CGCA056_v013004 [Colletotrichum aenigma]|uniref:uncharacterized protein n=1 Tax=Colletotrichum aenigma TaxID=1215731 RepID=UPI0018733D01|nr:uncharacterized protein CGCA056_v013004 [Colletotrichum aenigma]KAF5506945.1 hypothetical protein CGCA056_v013004 [Colletotrichum aenigma]